MVAAVAYSYMYWIHWLLVSCLAHDSDHLNCVHLSIFTDITKNVEILAYLMSVMRVLFSHVSGCNRRFFQTRCTNNICKCKYEPNGASAKEHLGKRPKYLQAQGHDIVPNLLCLEQFSEAGALIRQCAQNLRRLLVHNLLEDNQQSKQTRSRGFQKRCKSPVL